jgi:hypothetical protein
MNMTIPAPMISWSLQFLIESIPGGYKITGESSDAGGDHLIGEAYASTEGQIPARIRALVAKNFRQEQAS